MEPNARCDPNWILVQKENSKKHLLDNRGNLSIQSWLDNLGNYFLDVLVAWL